MVAVSQRLAELGLRLPDPPTALATYVPARRVGNLLFLSGHVCRNRAGVVRGVVGDDLDVETAAALAREVALDLLSSGAAQLGSPDAISGVVRITVYVRSAAGFDSQSAVANGASDLLVQVFGEQHGRHARSAVGVAQLPLGAALEIEAVFETSGE